MKADLHSHSFFSDGKQTPEFLVQRAIENGLSHLAITDHDCTDALAALPADQDRLVVIKGVEISCQWNSMEVHIVGLFISPQHAEMLDLLHVQQQQRKLRAQAMNDKLELLGIHGLSAYFESLPCISYTRSHVADFLVMQKICKNRQKTFKSYLGKRGKIFVKSNWCSLTKAISCINAAGGIAVIAHPGRYSLSKRKLEQLADDFKSCGGEAIEGSYSNIDPIMQKYLRDLALSRSLYLSAGSDFHDANAHWTDIGKFPALDQQAQKNAIWLHPKWHS